MQKMARGGESAYEELFQYACPKFITPAPPSLDAPSMNTNQVPPWHKNLMALHKQRRLHIFAYIRMEQALAVPSMIQHHLRDLKIRLGMWRDLEVICKLSTSQGDLDEVHF